MRRFYLHPNQPLPLNHNQVVPRTLAQGFANRNPKSAAFARNAGSAFSPRCFRVNDRVRPNSHRLCQHLRISLLHPPLSPASATPVTPLLPMLDRRPIPVPHPLHIHTFPHVSPISANRRSFPYEFRQFHTRSARPAPPHPPKGRAASRQLSCQRSIPPFALSFRAKQNPRQAGLCEVEKPCLSSTPPKTKPPSDSKSVEAKPHNRLPYILNKTPPRSDDPTHTPL